jgi:hypothetical protein
MTSYELDDYRVLGLDRDFRTLQQLYLQWLPLPDEFETPSALPVAV